MEVVPAEEFEVWEDPLLNGHEFITDEQQNCDQQPTTARDLVLEVATTSLGGVLEDVSSRYAEYYRKIVEEDSLLKSPEHQLKRHASGAGILCSPTRSSPGLSRFSHDGSGVALGGAAVIPAASPSRKLSFERNRMGSGLVSTVSSGHHQHSAALPPLPPRHPSGRAPSGYALGDLLAKQPSGEPQHSAPADMDAESHASRSSSDMGTDPSRSMSGPMRESEDPSRPSSSGAPQFPTAISHAPATTGGSFFGIKQLQPPASGHSLNLSNAESFEFLQSLHVATAGADFGTPTSAAKRAKRGLLFGDATGPCSPCTKASLLR
mmetsp:Transcript_23194/g.50916  ORF Transcript_23194/g.50916 Transcript_23194/m.50916 type:complete len:321 (-) Transcript_23194:319-1281(-)